MWPFSRVSRGSGNRVLNSLTGPKREYLVCDDCRNWFYLTSLEIRFYDESDSPLPTHCRVCARKAREARMELALDTQSAEQRVANG